MFARLREDIHSVFDRDPAARSVLEVLTCYPGIHAIFHTHGPASTVIGRAHAKTGAIRIWSGALEDWPSAPINATPAIASAVAQAYRRFSAARSRTTRRTSTSWRGRSRTSASAAT